MELTKDQFVKNCSELNQKLLETNDIKETVSDETCFKAIVIVKNMKVDATGDALLYASALNVLNTYVKQDKENKETVGYFFKNYVDVLSKYKTEHPEDDLVRIELQKDKDMPLMIVEISKIQFSFHQVNVNETNKIYAVKDPDHPEIVWDGIRKQNCANTLYEFADENTYERTNSMMDGSDYQEGMAQLLEKYHNGEMTLTDAKKQVYGNNGSKDQKSEEQKGYEHSVLEQEEHPFDGKPVVCLYTNTLEVFLKNLEDKKLAEYLIKSLEEGFGKEANYLYEIYVKYCFESIRSVFSSRKYDPECGVRVNYVQDDNIGRFALDFFSKDENGQLYTSTLYLISWVSMRSSDRIKMVYCKRNLKSEEKLDIHPSYQMEAYLSYMRKKSGAIRASMGNSACYLYDMNSFYQNEDAFAEEEKRKQYPAFFVSQEDQLFDWLKDTLQNGCGPEAISEFTQCSGETDLEYDTFIYADRKKIEEEINEKIEKKENCLIAVNGRIGSQREELLEDIGRDFKEAGRKVCILRKVDDPVDLNADILIYSGFIPNQLQYSSIPVQVFSYCCWVMDEVQMEEMLELYEEFEDKNFKVYHNTLTSAPEFNDDGAGNNWLIINFAMGPHVNQFWNSNTYSIKVVDSENDFTHAPGEANIIIGQKIRYNPASCTIVADRASQIELYRKLAEGKKGVNLLIKDPDLKLFILKKISYAEEDLQWIQKYNYASGLESADVSSLFENASKESKIYRKCGKMTIEHLGFSAWEKMTDETRDFAVSALASYYTMKELDEMMDFSGAILLISKVYEVESCKRFGSQYVDFVRNKYGEDKYMDMLPKALVDEKNDGVKKLLKDTQLTLGSIPHIMGLDGHGNIENEDEFRNFEVYAKEELFESKENIYEQAREITKILDYVRVNYRNKAAHKDALDVVAAQECMDYSILEKRKIGELMDYFEK